MLRIMMVTLLLCFACFVPDAQAGNRELLQLMEMLKQNGTITADQFDLLKQAMQQPEQAKADSKSTVEAKQSEVISPSSDSVNAIIDLTPAEPARVSTAAGGLKVDSWDGRSFFEINGLVTADAAFYNQDQTHLGDAAEMRHARITLSGQMHAFFPFELEYDFAGDAAQVKDAWLGYTGLSNTRFRLGLFKESFSLEEMTSSKHQPFMERSLINVFAPGRNIGFGFNSYGDNEKWTVAAGLFGEGSASADNATDDEGWGVGGRFTVAPFSEGQRLLHIGVSVNRRYLARNAFGEAKLRYRARPESHATNIRLVNSGKVRDIDYVDLYGLELAAAYGPLSLQGETVYARVTRLAGAGLQIKYNGYYGLVSYFFTGESRNYKHKTGRFGRLTPFSNFDLSQGGAGAWELAVRYSHLDLEDIAAGITGGIQDNTSIGLNWHLNPQIRLMMNYIWVNTHPSALLVSDDPQIFQLRAKYDF